MQVRVLKQISETDAASWNALCGDRYPFLRHEFLHALEACDCLGEHVGWLPHHLIFEEDGQVVAAMPMYLKLNSFGEFVFDWAWADAYQRAGLDYYPKLVVASPFTPASGPRVLTSTDEKAPERVQRCIEAALEQARSLGASSCHWLFATDTGLRDSPHLLLRQHYQFHWQNVGYGDFEHYLSFMASRKRKQIRKERREVADAGVRFRRLLGSELSEADWRLFHSLYRNTFERYGNYPALTLRFFQDLGRNLGENVWVVFAELHGTVIATAFFLVGEDTLYGRYWGCSGEIQSLHFEACYYQGLDFCLERGLKHFEPGAQGEHKISRGFLPTSTWSMHWIAEPRFRGAIADFLRRETAQVQRYMAELNQQSPFKAWSNDGERGPEVGPSPNASRRRDQ